LLTIELIKAARALLSWSQKDLAEKSGVPYATLAKLEAREGPLATRGSTENNLRAALEAAGIEFLNHGQPGVRLKKAKTPEQLASKIADLHEALPVVDEKAKPSPQKAMKQLEHAHVKNEIAKVKDRHTKLIAKNTKPKS